ncbi:ShlB/FhaC/HecB family hemolysin secretion/activation protein [Klebsiella variicola subsp. variicola]|nr:ShlB/FhaC/HecB family hemolysin secretion/activation protein [Klebsiella variicola subsp. variicola]
MRGFKEQHLLGNRGGYWRNELTGQLLTLPVTGGGLSATGAVDIGTCHQPERNNRRWHAYWSLIWL